MQIYKYTNTQIRKHNTKSKCTGGCSEEQPTVSKQELSPSSRASLMLFPLQFVAAGDVFIDGWDDGYHDGDDDDDDSICCQWRNSWWSAVSALAQGFIKAPLHSRMPTHFHILIWGLYYVGHEGISDTIFNFKQNVWSKYRQKKYTKEKKSCASVLIRFSPIFGRGWKKPKQVEPSTLTCRHMWGALKPIKQKSNHTFVSEIKSHIWPKLAAAYSEKQISDLDQIFWKLFWSPQMCSVNINAMFGEALPLALWRVTDIHEYLIRAFSLEN